MLWNVTTESDFISDHGDCVVAGDHDKVGVNVKAVKYWNSSRTIDIVSQPPLVVYLQEVFLSCYASLYATITIYIIRLWEENLNVSELELARAAVTGKLSEVNGICVKILISFVIIDVYKSIS